ncbi:TetR/AcrR family transcriptional regulator [Rosenbergiella epipactidis]|uniref:TetR/AcrR family transcriptional regulator n=1 Tax=Rosenbergiella epipactidis TaxID=1544694 RepID=UPI001F4E4C2C|nr:TetR/AcrR family transcriptional regulator [Rosenbergiella epipactidis]
MSRTRRSDGAATRTKLLNCAGELIAQQGFAHTTNKEIAQFAGVDLASINYHFGGRERLYLAVLSEAHRHFIDANDLNTLINNDQSPHDRFESFIDMIVDKMQAISGWYSQVLFREIFSPSVQLAEFIRIEGMAKILCVRTIICQAVGLSEDDPRVPLCMLNVVAPCLMLMVAGGKVPGPIGVIAGMDKKVLSQHLKTFALAGFKAINPPDM